MQAFKTAAPLHVLSPHALAGPTNEILFVSSDGRDAIAATWFGDAMSRVNRAEAAAERLGASSHGTGRTCAIRSTS